MRVRLVKDFSFESAQTLPQAPAGHKCRRMHGHSFKVEICVEGEVDPATGWFYDHAEISAAMKPKLIWIRTTPCDEAVHNRAGMTFHRFSADCDAYNRVADQIMAELNVPVIDLYAFTLNLGDDLYCDHVHFQEPVREKQAAFLAGWLVAFTEHGNAQPSAARDTAAEVTRAIAVQ